MSPCSICADEFTSSAVAFFALDHPISSSASAKHPIQIPHQSLRPLVSGKMSAIRMLALKHHGPQSPAPALRRNAEVFGEISQPELDVRDVSSERSSTEISCVAHFVVDPRAGGGPRGREPVDGDPGEDFVVGPRVGVGPVVEFLVDPGE